MTLNDLEVEVYFSYCNLCECIASAVQQILVTKHDLILVLLTVNDTELVDL